jgi:hypothetical protein
MALCLVFGLIIMTGVYVFGQLVIWLIYLVWPTVLWLLMVLARFFVGYAILNLLCYGFWGAKNKSGKPTEELSVSLWDIICWGFWLVLFPGDEEGVNESETTVFSEKTKCQKCHSVSGRCPTAEAVSGLTVSSNL